METESSSPRCRFCGTKLEYTFVDLGTQPLCESYLTRDQLNHMEPFFPLHVYVCASCFLVQLQEYVSPEAIFSEYAYFSSYSDTWLKHAENYVDMITDRLSLSNRSLVVELGSNDGYLLQYFVRRRIPVLGIEPAANVAEASARRGVQTLVKFFGYDVASELATQGKYADLLIGNNVLAQVPSLNDFVMGMKTLLKPQGIITMEFPHLMRLIRSNQFDTIYHEHFSYFSFIAVDRIFATHGLTIFDVEELPTHGGSLRIYARHSKNASLPLQPSVVDIREREEREGYRSLETYSEFSEKVKESKRKILETLIRIKNEGKCIVGYGAPGKGNTLLNYCGIRTDFLDYTVDRNPYKQGKFLPGSHIPIFPPDKIRETRPDYVMVLPWNLKQEIMTQLSFIGEWGGQFIVPIPTIKVLPAGR